MRAAYLALLTLACAAMVSAQAPPDLNAPLPLDKAIRTG
jgi:hypothetical protein